jgi:hypothetical protein
MSLNQYIRKVKPEVCKRTSGEKMENESLSEMDNKSLLT